jgi:hypothetical protein
MSDRKPDMFMPALLGGAAAGLLSGLPVVQCMCCLWIIGGAMLSAHLLANKSPVSLTAGEGAIVGALSGIFAAVVERLISIPLAAFSLGFARKLLESMSRFTEEMPSGWETWLDRSHALSPTLFLLGLMITAFIFAALGALGGILGASLFGKKPSPKIPPQGESNAPQNPGDRQP